MTDVWGNVSTTVEESGEKAGYATLDYAGGQTSDFVSHTIDGFYDSYTLENQESISSFTSNIAGFDPNADNNQYLNVFKKDPQLDSHYVLLILIFNLDHRIMQC